MLRSVLAAIAGYVVMVAVVMLGIGIVWGLLGGTGAFAGEGPAPSGIWLVLNYIFGFAAAMAAGWAALRIGKSQRAVQILIGMMLVVGLYMAINAEANWADNEPVGKPVAEMSFMEAGQHAKAPVWYNWTIPLVGAIGAFLGGRQRD